jgi:hypothetical protein
MPSRVAQLIRFFVDRVPGAGRTRLVKSLYMADHEARRYLGHPLTDLVYRWDEHGPFDPEILRQLDHMQAAGYMNQEIKHAAGTTHYMNTSAETPSFCPLKRDEMAILEYVVNSYASMILDDLLEEIVYQTRPMTSAEKLGDRLKMELVDREQRIPGLELERMLEAAEELKAGKVISLEKLLAEID